MKADCGSGCDARRLPTGRSIRAWRTLCGRQMTRNVRGRVSGRRLSIASSMSRQRRPERAHLVSELPLLAHAGERRVDMSDVASGNRHRGFDILADAKHQGHDGERFMRGYALREAFASSDTSVPPRFAAQVVERRDREVVEIPAVGLEGCDGPLTGQALLYRRHYDLRYGGLPR
jgi:hypothetical protein